MENGHENVWLRRIVPRSIIHAILGTFVGGIWGAICLGVAGLIIGGVMDYINHYFFTENSDFLLCSLFGSVAGGVTGSVIGLLAWAIIGIIAHPSITHSWPVKSLVRSTTAAMGVATLFALIGYFSWNLCLAAFGRKFSDSLDDTLLFALFVLPALMGLGQIVGVWCAAIQLKKPQGEAK